MEGWWLCNGRNGTPDLGGRFLVGKDSNSRLSSDYFTAGKTGGLEKLKLTVNEMQIHTHFDSGHQHFNQLATDAAGNHQHSFVRPSYIPGPEGIVFNKYGNQATQITERTDYQGAHSYTINSWSNAASAVLSNAGSGEEHENRPPF